MRSAPTRSRSPAFIASFTSCWTWSRIVIETRVALGPAPTAGGSGLGQLDQLDLAERHLQEARAQLAEADGVLGADEAVGALAALAALQPLLRQHPLHG